MENRRNDARYTYREYLAWPEDARYELIEGAAYALAAPSTEHQRLSRRLERWIDEALEGKPCEMFHAPFDVRFENDEDADTVVQPDISVICQPERITPQGACGAPTLIVEILSPSSVIYDMNTKRRLYEEKGVAEYWIISPEDRSVAQLVLRDGHYESFSHTGGAFSAQMLPGLTIDLEALFAGRG